MALFNIPPRLLVRGFLLATISAYPLLAVSTSEAQILQPDPPQPQEMTADERLAQRLFEAGTTDYTRRLFDLSRQYAQLLEKDGIGKLVLLDPDRVNGLLGTREVDGKDVTQTVARSTGTIVGNELAEVVGGNITGLDVKFEGVSGIERQEPSPLAARATPDMEARILPADTCVILAAGHEIHGARVGEFKPAEAALYANRHEFWHCMDKFMDAQLHDFNSASMHEAYGKSYTIRRETFADVAAAGDLIALDGMNADYVISNIALFRMENAADDPLHFSAPALEALGSAVNAIGGASVLGAMSPEARKEFYARVTLENTLSGPEIMMLDAAPAPDAAKEEHARYYENIRKSPGMQFLARTYHQYYSAEAAARFESLSSPETAPAPMSAEERTTVETWDAEKVLVAKAAEIAGSDADADAVALARARAGLLNELRRSQTGPEVRQSQFLPAMEAKLESAFTDIMMRMQVFGREESAAEPMPAAEAASGAAAMPETPPSAPARTPVRPPRHGPRS